MNDSTMKKKEDGAKNDFEGGGDEGTFLQVTA